MSKHTFAILLGLTIFFAIRVHAATVTVSAGEFDRCDTPTYFSIPKEMVADSFQLRDADGKWLPVQQFRNSFRACFILPELKAGRSRTYTLVENPKEGPFTVALATHTGPTETVMIGGKEVLTYQGAKSNLPDGFEPQYQRGGYIFPVLTPSGKSVVDDYPPNHKHHHGIWAPWTKTEYEGRHPDFWNMGAKSGTVEPVGKAETESGPVFARIRATHQFVDLSATPPKSALNETWALTVYTLGASDAKVRVFDLESTQTCASESPLKLPKYLYGGLGVRGNRAWNGKENTTFLTSEGKDRSNGNETTAKWCHMGGKIDGELAGIAILCHPENFRAPQPMRLHPTEPFFCYAPSQAGDWEIVPGKPYVARYRFVVADGAADAEQLNRMWRDYATPPAVEVK